jgi:hypothetical protein
MCDSSRGFQLAPAMDGTWYCGKGHRGA